MRKLIMALAAVALFSAPAFASVQNVKISGSVDSSYIYRTNFDLGASNASEDETQSVFITQTLLRVDADLTDQVSAAIAVGNERPWNSAADEANNHNPGSSGAVTGASEIVIYQAYVTLREMLYSPLTLVVGRQTWKYGNSLIFDSTGTNNSAGADSGIQSVAGDLTKLTALDAVRAILDYNPLTIEAFVASVHQGTAGLVSTSGDTDGDGQIDNDNKYLYGIVGTYALGDELSTVVEAYLFWSHDKGTGTHKRDQIKLPGVRVSTNILEGLSVSAEYAHQGGVQATNSTVAIRERNATAMQLGANYSIPGMKEYDPVLSTRFTKLTGDSSTSAHTDDNNSAWDPFFENQHGGKIHNALFNFTNRMIAEASLAVTPLQDVRSTLSFTKLWTHVDTAGGAGTFSLVQPDGSTSSQDAARGERELGHEIDFDTTYAYTEDVNIGISLGWFRPGSVFTRAELDGEDGAKQALVSLGVAF